MQAPRIRIVQESEATGDCPSNRKRWISWTPAVIVVVVTKAMGATTTQR